MVKKKPRLRYNMVKWKEFWDEECNIDNMWNVMLQIILDCANIHCPIVNIKILDDSPNWFTKEIIEEIQYKEFLYKEAKFDDDDESWNIFRVKKKEVKKMLHNAIEAYIKEQLETQNNNPKKFWRNINNLSGLGKSGKRGGLTRIKVDGDIVLENQAAADYMNTLYVNAGPDMAKKFDNVWNGQHCNIDTDSVFTFDFVSETDM